MYKLRLACGESQLQPLMEASQQRHHVAEPTQKSGSEQLVQLHVSVADGVDTGSAFDRVAVVVAAVVVAAVVGDSMVWLQCCE